MGTADQHGDDLAAILLNPLDQSPGRDTVEAHSEFITAIERVRRRTETLLIFDDVRHGFRMHPEGSYRVLGVTPDLTCVGKALGNGHAIAALLGIEELRSAASELWFTATFCFGAVALKAAQTTVEIYDRDDVFGTINRAGERLRDGIVAAASAAGHDVSYTGPAAMPTLRFKGDPGQARRQAIFVGGSAARCAVSPNAQLVSQRRPRRRSDRRGD